MSEEENARELFGAVRGAPEPAWSPDTATLIRRGRRSVRARTVGGVGAVGFTAAVSAFAYVALGGGSPATHTTAVPGAGSPTTAVATVHPTTPVPTAPAFVPQHSGLDAVMDYYDFDSYGIRAGVVTGDNAPAYAPLTVRAEKTLSAILTRLDPDHKHLRSDPQAMPKPRLLPDSDPIARGLIETQETTWWSEDGRQPSFGAGSGLPDVGGLHVDIQSSHYLDSPGAYRGSMTDPSAPCGYQDAVNQVKVLAFGNGKTGPGGITWSSCVTRTLPDGSVVKSSTGTLTSRTVIVAFRVSPDGKGLVALYATDFPPGAGKALASPSWQSADLMDALSDGAVSWDLAPGD